MTKSRLLHWISGTLAFVALAACSDSTGTKRVPLSISFTTKAFSRASAFSVANDILVGTSGELVITKAQIVLDGIELSRTEGPDCNGTGAAQCEQLDGVPELIDLPVTTGAKSLLSVSVPEGTYTRLDAEIRKPEGSEAAAAAFLAAHPEFKDKSVRVEGTYKGKPFVYSALIKVDLEMRFNPPLVITAASRNITIDADVASWFKDSSGAAMDPSLSGNAATIEANIRNSFKGFEDNDQDGNSDK